ncbi:two-component system sensor histidine kinase QseC, partial [Serratia marcescens]|nr:two-component system sensor histidine kinase QseC [Serratia marcescens]
GAECLCVGEREGCTDGERTGDDDRWRLLWRTSPDGRYRFVVGQEGDSRRDRARGLVTGQRGPGRATLPLRVLLIALRGGRERRPRPGVAAG